MPCNCTGSHIFGRLQKLSSLQKLQTISKSGLCAYNEHVENTAQALDTSDGPSSLCQASSLPLSEPWSPPSLRSQVKQSPSAMLPLSLQSGLLTQQQSLRSLSTKRSHSTAATKASAAYLKTQQLFEDDRQFALQQQHLSSPRVAAAQQSSDSTPSADQQTSDLHAHKQQGSGGVTLGRSSSDGLSVADSVSSYHGYSGVNYQSGIKDIDDVPNQWGYSLKDYKVIFGEGYVHGCVPWEDQHITKQDHKQFQKLHSRRVQLLQELHDVEQGIRELMQ